MCNFLQFIVEKRPWSTKVDDSLGNSNVCVINYIDEFKKKFYLKTKKATFCYFLFCL